MEIHSARTVMFALVSEPMPNRLCRSKRAWASGNNMEVVSLDEFELRQLQYQDRDMYQDAARSEVLTQHRAAADMVVQFGELQSG